MPHAGRSAASWLGAALLRHAATASLSAELLAGAPHVVPVARPISQAPLGIPVSGTSCTTCPAPIS
jgi:hypothetical protein